MKAQQNHLFRDTAFYSSVINGLLILPTIGLNGVIILTILKTRSLRNASNWFLGNLMLTDLLMGLCGQPLYIVARIWSLNSFQEECELAMAERFFSNILPLTLMTTLTVSSLDRYLAIRLMLQYRANVTTFRAMIAVFLLWIFSFICGGLLVAFGPAGFMVFLGIMFIVCLGVTFIAYFKAFHGLKRHQAQVNPAESTTCINVRKYQRSFMTMFFVFLLQLVFYAPVITCHFIIAANYIDTRSFILIFIADTITYTNAAVNPVFFLWRMREVRRACKRTLKKLFTKQQS